MYTIENLELTQINRDVNGNPRYVVHFLTFLRNSDFEKFHHEEQYKLALKRAKTIGGKRYHTKTFGGGIVFQSFNTNNLKNSIIDLVKSL